MTTPRELITGALRLINVVQSNESPTSDDMDISFEALNGMLDSWSNEKLSIYSMNPYIFNLRANQKEYTLGPGGDWDIERPMELQMMYVMYSPEGGDCTAYNPHPPFDGHFTRYGEMVAVDGFVIGYDNVIGILGYESESNPFTEPFSMGYGTTQYAPDTITSHNRLCYGTVDYVDLHIGSGNIPDSPGETGPFSQENSRDFHDTESFYYRRHFWLPMTNGDQMWVVDTDFPGLGLGFTITVVVGPTKDYGEKYVCTGGYSILPGPPPAGDAVIYIERVSWAGDR